MPKNFDFKNSEAVEKTLILRTVKLLKSGGVSAIGSKFSDFTFRSYKRLKFAKKKDIFFFFCHILESVPASLYFIQRQ